MAFSHGALADGQDGAIFLLGGGVFALRAKSFPQAVPDDECMAMFRPQDVPGVGRGSAKLHFGLRIFAVGIKLIGVIVAFLQRGPVFVTRGESEDREGSDGEEEGKRGRAGGG